MLRVFSPARGRVRMFHLYTCLFDRKKVGRRVRPARGRVRIRTSTQAWLGANVGKRVSPARGRVRMCNYTKMPVFAQRSVGVFVERGHVLKYVTQQMPAERNFR